MGFHITSGESQRLTLDPSRHPYARTLDVMAAASVLRPLENEEDFCGGANVLYSYLDEAPRPRGFGSDKQ